MYTTVLQHPVDMISDSLAQSSLTDHKCVRLGVFCFILYMYCWSMLINSCSEFLRAQNRPRLLCTLRISDWHISNMQKFIPLCAQQISILDLGVECALFQGVKHICHTIPKIILDRKFSSFREHNTELCKFHIPVQEMCVTIEPTYRV